MKRSRERRGKERRDIQLHDELKSNRSQKHTQKGST